MIRRIGTSIALGAGLVLALAGPAQAATTTVYVPEDFVPTLSDTRTTGHYEVVDAGLHIWTEGAISTDKVAEYVDTSTPLARAGEPTIRYANTAGGLPGFQLVVDFDANGTRDGILVGEASVYGNDWWLNNAAATFVKDGAPSHTGGSGSGNHGTLEQWRDAFPDAVVEAFGFSLGSGVKGDGIITALEFAGDRYVFGKHTCLTGKDECKNGGWATSTAPVFDNQGDCVSSFASAKKKK
jgi:hypothetical protein